MPRHRFRALAERLQPTVDKITAHPVVMRYFPAIADPDLWHLNRRSAARAVAIGLFCGLIPGPLQALASIAGCVLVRANFSVAIITTFYTNPFTIVPLYVLAYEYGCLFFPDIERGSALAIPPYVGWSDWVPQMFAWMAGLGKPLALGLLLLATTLAALGWLIVSLGWRWHTVRAWRRRARLRTAALKSS
jgi:uncharacterized protein (DUF2062 family)